MRSRLLRPGRYNVAYGDTGGQTLDIFRGDGEGVQPIQIFIHGGYWRSLDSKDHSFVIEAFAPAGVTTLVINYDLMPDVAMDVLVTQCRRACAWAFRNAAAINCDASRIFVSGHSAGGHLACEMLATDFPAFADDLPADLLKGACGVSGLYDLEPIRLSFMGPALKLTPADDVALSTVRKAPRGGGSLLLAVGALEGPEYLRQTRDLATAWGPECRLLGAVEQDGHDHFSIAAELGRFDSPLSVAVRSQMGVG
jgi:arylformamidase